MTSRFQRIVFRTSTSNPDAQKTDSSRDRHPPPNGIDPATVLSQVRSALATVQLTQAELHRREEELLTEASTLYEQLKATAISLADIRQQLDVAARQADQLQSAAGRLEDRPAVAHEADHRDRVAPDTFIVQPQD